MNICINCNNFVIGKEITKSYSKEGYTVCFPCMGWAMVGCYETLETAKEIIR